MLKLQHELFTSKAEGLVLRFSLKIVPFNGMTTPNQQFLLDFQLPYGWMNRRLRKVVYGRRCGRALHGGKHDLI